MNYAMYNQAQGQVDENKYNTQALENNYWQGNPYDFDTQMRPTVLPHESYGKYYYPDFFSKPGNDWEAACP